MSYKHQLACCLAVVLPGLCMYGALVCSCPRPNVVPTFLLDPQASQKAPDSGSVCMRRKRVEAPACAGGGGLYRLGSRGRPSAALNRRRSSGFRCLHPRLRCHKVTSRFGPRRNRLSIRACFGRRRCRGFCTGLSVSCTIRTWLVLFGSGRCNLDCSFIDLVHRLCVQNILQAKTITGARRSSETGMPDPAGVRHNSMPPSARAIALSSIREECASSR